MPVPLFIRDRNLALETPTQKMCDLQALLRIFLVLLLDLHTAIMPSKQCKAHTYVLHRRDRELSGHRKINVTKIP
jgi:hypothetical protein